MGRTIDVAAYAWRHGACVRRGLQPNAEGIVLELRGEASLTGQVLRPDGEPEQGLTLFARKVGSQLKHSQWGGAFPTPEDGLSFAGLEVGLAQTDDRGQFAMQGLAVGEYELFLIPDRGSFEFDYDTPWRVLETSAQAHHIEYRSPRLEVVLLDEDGQAWSTDALEQHCEDLWWWGRDAIKLQTWPEQPQLLVWRLGSARLTGLDAVGLLPVRQRVLAAGQPTSTFFVEAQPGAFYSVQVVGGPFRGEPRLVQAPIDGSPARVELRAPATVPRGQLVIEGLRNGAKIHLEEYRATYGLWIADYETGMPLVAQGSYEPIQTSQNLPVGKYRVVIEGRPYVDSHHGTLQSPRSTGRAEQVVEIREGEVAKAKLDVQQGGWLDLVVEASPAHADLQAVRKQRPDADPNADWMFAASCQAEVVLRRPHTLDEPVFWSGIAGEGTTSYGTHLKEGWSFGVRHKTEMLPAGTFEIVATTPSGRSVSQTVEIELGEVLSLRLVIPAD